MGPPENPARFRLLPQQVFTWRREMRGSEFTESGQAFAPVLIEASPEPAAALVEGSSIEISMCGATVRIPPGSDARLVATVLRALKDRA
jgi:transposase